MLLWQDAYDSNGQRSFLSVYDSQGQKQGADILVDDTGKIGGDYGFHVVVNPGDGSGVITTQGHQYSPIFYKRFDSSHQFIDSTFQEVPFTSNNNSSWYESHDAGVNRNGDFVIQWQNFLTKTMEACFFSASGALRNHVILGSLQGYGIDGFRYRHQKVECVGGNFILRNTGNTANPVWLYAPDGTQLGTASSPADPKRVRANFGPTGFIEQVTSGQVSLVPLHFN